MESRVGLHEFIYFFLSISNEHNLYIVIRLLLCLLPYCHHLSLNLLSQDEVLQGTLPPLHAGCGALLVPLAWVTITLLIYLLMKLHMAPSMGLF